MSIVGDKLISGEIYFTAGISTAFIRPDNISFPVLLSLKIGLPLIGCNITSSSTYFILREGTLRDFINPALICNPIKLSSFTHRPLAGFNILPLGHIF